jgi:hypothetical protein
MRTGEDTLELGLYASACCGSELVFDKDDCFCRCPRCQALTDWEIVDVDIEGGVAA